MAESYQKAYESTNTDILGIVIAMDDGRKFTMDGKDVISIYFIEDIFSHSITGKIEFLDMYGFQEFAPFTGEEQIILVYGEDNNLLTFDIWKMSSSEQTNPTEPTAERLITLFFVDTMFKKLIIPRYSRSWENDTKGTEIIEHLFKNMIEIENYNIEPSSTELDFVMPYWNCMDSIRWILPRLRSITNESGYVFFNNTKSVFSTNVITLNKLFGTSTEVGKIDYSLEAVGPNPGATPDEGMQNKDFKIFDWKMEGIDHVSTKGLQGGTSHGYDFMRKKLLSEDYTYSTMLEKTTLLGRQGLFSDISNEYGAFDIYAENDEEIIKNIAYSEWLQRYSRQQSLMVIVAGSVKRYAGMQIEMRWPSSSKDEIFDSNLRGRYLIKSVTHMFKFDSNIPYRQKLILLKNGYESSRKKGLVGGSKKNVGDKTLIK